MEVAWSISTPLLERSVCINGNGRWIASSPRRKTRVLLVRSAPLQFIRPKDSKKRVLLALPAPLQLQNMMEYKSLFIQFDCCMLGVQRREQSLAGIHFKKKGKRDAMVRYFLYHSYRGFKRPWSHMHHLSNERCLCLLRPIPLIWFWTKIENV